MSNKINADLIEESFSVVQPVGKEVVDLFYRKLFAEHPEVRPILGKGDIADQKKHFLNSLTATVNNLRNSDGREITFEIPEEGAQEKKAKHYTVIKERLLDTLATILGISWTKEINSEWKKFLDKATPEMIQAPQKR